MGHYLVTLIGFHGETLYQQIVATDSKSHASRIAGVTFGQCYHHAITIMFDSRELPLWC